MFWPRSRFAPKSEKASSGNSCCWLHLAGIAGGSRGYFAVQRVRYFGPKVRHFEWFLQRVGRGAVFGTAGHEDDRQVRIALSQSARQFRAGQTRHLHIRQDDVDFGGVPFEDQDSFGGNVRLEHSVASHPQHLSGKRENAYIVIDNKNRFCPLGGTDGLPITHVSGYAHESATSYPAKPVVTPPFLEYFSGKTEGRRQVGRELRSPDLGVPRSAPVRRCCAGPSFP